MKTREEINDYVRNWRKKNNEKVVRAALEKRMANPEKFRQRKRAYKLVSRFLTPEPCLFCSKTPTQAHHEDYEAPLEVVWLCHRHHKNIETMVFRIRLREGLDLLGK